jgi:hypothetical protein
MSLIVDAMAGGTTRHFQPAPQIRDFGADNAPETGMNARLAMLVGLIALGLPVVMLLTPVVGGCLRDSISHHYYEPLVGSVFVGMLSFIGGFLIAYRGENRAENFGASLAGLGAFGVAVWPTTGHGCETMAGVTSRVFVVANPDGNLELASDHDPFSLFAGVADLHAMSAAIVFGFLGLFVLVVLRRVVPDRHMVNGQIIPTKRARNVLYSLTGGTILLCIAVLGLKSMGNADFLAKWNLMNLTFWIEAVALWAFALAWLAKGRVFVAVNDPV